MNEESNNMDWLGIGLGAAGMASSFASRIGQKKRERRQMDYQKELMDIQHRNQRNLNQQGAELSYQMWLDTNAQAQMKELQKAGLNPALMYKQSGPGGTTSAGSGGGASGGSAPQVQNLPMDIGNALSAVKLSQEVNILKEQQKNIEADTKLKETQAGKTVAETENLGAMFDKIISETDSYRANTELTKVRRDHEEWQRDLTRYTFQDQADMARKRNQQMTQELRQATAGAEVAEGTVDDLIRSAQLDNVTKVLGHELQRQGARKTEAEVKNIIQDYVQNRDRLELDMRKLDDADQMRQLQKELGLKNLELKEFQIWMSTLGKLVPGINIFQYDGPGPQR